ncbi:MAG TPA: hypothetical protein VFM13_04425 [Gaiellaceae bacterium]|nr:hypothetical protein [Gaiellaceae bacterium]
MNTEHRAIVVVGREGPAEDTLRAAGRYDEVFVIAPALPDPRERFVVDEDRAYEAAHGRVRDVVGRLRARGVRAFGAVGDENVAAARRDARALFPAAQAILGA